MSIYTRVKSYALRTGPYLYDMRFLLAGFAITYLGVSKIAAAGAKSKSLLSVSQRSTCGLNLVKLTQNDTKNLLIVPSYTDHPNHFFLVTEPVTGKGGMESYTCSYRLCKFLILFALSND